MYDAFRVIMGSVTVARDHAGCPVARPNLPRAFHDGRIGSYDEVRRHAARDDVDAFRYGLA